MKILNKSIISLLLLSALILTGCGIFKKSSSGEENQPEPEQIPDTPIDDDPGEGGGPSGPVKVVVGAHTLKDNNPPINVNGKGEAISEDKWNEFKAAPQSYFSNHYNYTYETNSSYQTVEKFTKNGYYMENPYTVQYYERKSGNTFYYYVKQSDGSFLRTETNALDLQYKYTYPPYHQIYLNMDEYSNYTFSSGTGIYSYEYVNHKSEFKFQNGYLTYFKYILEGVTLYEIKASFATTINIPESYYYA